MYVNINTVPAANTCLIMIAMPSITISSKSVKIYRTIVGWRRDENLLQLAFTQNLWGFWISSVSWLSRNAKRYKSTEKLQTAAPRRRVIFMTSQGLYEAWKNKYNTWHCYRTYFNFISIQICHLFISSFLKCLLSPDLGQITQLINKCPHRNMFSSSVYKVHNFSI